MAILLCFSFDWSILFRKKGWDSAVSFEKKYFFKHAVNRNCKHADKYLVNYFLGMTVLLTLLVVLTAKFNLQYWMLKLQVVWNLQEMLN